MLRQLHIVNVEAEKNVIAFAIKLFLLDLGEQRQAPDEWQKAAANDAIAAFLCGEYGQALACIDVGETPANERPLMTFTDEERKLSLRQLWQCFGACSTPVADRRGHQPPATIAA